MNRLKQAIELFDTYNKKDPHHFTYLGTVYPQEYFLAIKLYEWVLKLQPNASEFLLLASRSQHIGRWEIARETYPDGREGYLKWRKDLAHFHADKASEMMLKTGYTAEECNRVKQIILKQKIKVDEEVQVMENALCLVFLEFQYEDFYPKHSPDKVVNILRKSLLKMDANGHQFALNLTFTEQGKQYVLEAVQAIS